MCMFPRREINLINGRRFEDFWGVYLPMLSWEIGFLQIQSVQKAVEGMLQRSLSEYISGINHVGKFDLFHGQTFACLHVSIKQQFFTLTGSMDVLLWRLTVSTFWYSVLWFQLHRVDLNYSNILQILSVMLTRQIFHGDLEVEMCWWDENNNFVNTVLITYLQWTSCTDSINGPLMHYIIQRVKTIDRSW